GFAHRGELDLPLEALNDDFAGGFMLRKFLACRHHDPRDFNVFGLEQGGRSRPSQSLPKWPDINNFSRLCMLNCQFDFPGIPSFGLLPRATWRVGLVDAQPTSPISILPR